MRTKAMRLLKLAMVTAFLATAQSAFAYVIDGNVSDWGVYINANNSATGKIGYLNKDLPSGGRDIDYVTEDNADYNYLNGNYVYKGYRAYKVGPGYSRGNVCDAEAIYFDNDDKYMYISIIQGLPIGGAALPKTWSPNYVYPGDIAISVDGDYAYEYGIDIINSNHANLVKNAKWQLGTYSKTPYKITGGTTVNTSVKFAYSYNVQGHYVMEVAIPLSAFGITLNYGDAARRVNVHWTMSCGNDYLTLAADLNPTKIKPPVKPPVVPEPGTMALFGSGLVGLFGLIRRKASGK